MLVMGYTVLPHVLVIPIIILFACFVIFWTIFFFVFETLVIVSVDDKVEYLQDPVD